MPGTKDEQGVPLGLALVNLGPGVPAIMPLGRVTETDMAADWFEALHSRVRGTSS